MKKSRMLVFVVALSTIVVAAEAQRRGFSTSGAGSGSYDGAAPTASWDIDNSLDGDCLAEYAKVRAELSPAQYQAVKTQYDAAVAANYDSNADFETAEALGYSLTATDGTTWSAAKSANSSLESDCNDTHSGDCDAVSKTQFVEVNDGRAAAIAAGYDSYSDWSDANAQGYSQNATDQAIWAEAKGNAISAACEAEVPGTTDCSNLTKSQYQSAQQGNALMATKIAKVTAGTLTVSDLTDLSLDLTTGSTLGNSPAQWKIDYLETVLATATGTQKSAWQSTIDNFSLTNATAWYLGELAQGNYAAANATTTLFTDAGVTGSVITALGVADAQIQSNIASAGWTAAPSTTDMQNFLTEAIGFADGTTYADVLAATGTTAASNFSTDNAVHMDYVNNCAQGAANPASAISTCAASSDFTANLKAFKIGKAIADDSGSYTIAGTVTTSELSGVGVPANSTNVIGGNYCGTSGTDSCLTALKTALAVSDLTASSTPAQVKTKINDLMQAEMVTVADNAVVPTPSAPPASGCTTAVNLDLPSTCGHPQWTCTLQSGPTDWTIASNNLVIPAGYSGTGSQSATIRMALDIYTPAYTVDITKTYDVQTAIADATNGKKRYNNGSSEDVVTAQNACRAKGGRLATKSEHDSLGTTTYSLFHWSTDDPDISYSVACGNGKCTTGNSCNFGSNQRVKRRNSDGWKSCEGSGTRNTIHYTCADLPSCE